MNFVNTNVHMPLVMVFGGHTVGYNRPSVRPLFREIDTQLDRDQGYHQYYVQRKGIK